MIFKLSILSLFVLFIQLEAFASPEPMQEVKKDIAFVMKMNFSFLDSDIKQFNDLLSGFGENQSFDKTLKYSHLFMGLRVKEIEFLIGISPTYFVSDWEFGNNYAKLSIPYDIPIQLGYNVKLFDFFHIMPFAMLSYGNLNFTYEQNIDDDIKIIDTYNSDEKKFFTINSSLWYFDIGYEANIIFKLLESTNKFNKVEHHYIGLGFRMGFLNSWLTNWETESDIEVKGMPSKLFHLDRADFYMGLNVIWEVR